MKSDLDRLLRAWADRRELEAGRAQALSERACREPMQDPAPVATTGWRMAACFAALLVLVGLAVWRPSSRPAAAAPSLLSAADIQSRTLLYQELGRLFGTAFRSAVLTPAGMQLEVESAAEGADQPPLLLRLVVQRREGDSGAWAPVWHADVLASEQDPVRVGPANNGSLALWLLRTPDGRFVLDGSGHLPNLPNQLLSILNVIKPGAPAELQSFRQGRDVYRVVGIVESLEAHA